jgi:hypothetical protein
LDTICLIKFEIFSNDKNMNIKERFGKFSHIAAIGSAAASLLFLGIIPASAATSTYPSCSKSGFSGTIRIDYEKINTAQARIFEVSYRINKGSNSGGNNANVYYADNGTLPVKKFGTSFGIQDNQWHYLGGVYTTGTLNGISIKFVFDKSSASDPSCSTYIRLPI